jgi:hypothetical protein
MNGRALGDRAIEVSPSSARVLERAAEILTPFPVCSSWNLLTSSRVRTDLALEIGRVPPVASATFSVVLRVFDAHIHLPRLKAVNRIHPVSCTLFLPRCNQLRCRPTCPRLPANLANQHVPPRCPEVFPSVLVTGNVVPKVVDTTILQRMCLVCVVEQVVRRLL